MTRFIHSYHAAGRTEDLVLLGQDRVFALGGRAGNGVVSHVDEHGQTVWHQEYHLDGEPVHFDEGLSLGGAATDQSKSDSDDIIVLAHVAGKKGRGITVLLLRLTSSGGLVWVRQVRSDQTPTAHSLVRTQKGFAISRWFNGADGRDKVHILEVDANGDALIAVELDHQGDDEIGQLATFEDTMIAVGTTNQGGLQSGFITQLHPDREILLSISLRLTRKQSEDRIHRIEVVSPDHQDGHKHRFYVIGTTLKRGRTDTFITATNDLKNERDSFDFARQFHASIGDDTVIDTCLSRDSLFILGQDKDRKEPPYVLRFDTNLDLIWRKTFDMAGDYQLTTMQVHQQSQLWLAGETRRDTEKEPASALLIKTDFDLASCKTRELPAPEIEDTKVWIAGLDALVDDFDLDLREMDLKPSRFDTKVDPICPAKPDESTFTLDKGAWLQSPYLYLQSAGSSGNDAAPGVLLRWFLLRNLGDSHLPKGNHAQSSINFNRPDDFVRIYRASYVKNIAHTLDFKTEKPTVIDEGNARWVYVVNDQTYYLTLPDTARYQAARATYDPITQPHQFLTAYGDALCELEIRNTLAFATEADIEGSAAANLQLEVFSVQGDMPLDEEALSARQTYPNTAAIRVLAENTRRLKWRTFGGMLRAFRFEFYHDLFAANSAANWTDLGKYALSTDDAEVASRLEHPTQQGVHDHWQKFTADSKVNTQNYLDRWSAPNQGLKSGVQTYLTLSDSDPQAVTTHFEEVDFNSATGATNPSMDLSYLDLLQIAATDYHIARMCGLGTLDGQASSGAFIYMAVYTTDAALDDGGPAQTRQHLYISLPTSRDDERLPFALETLPPTYGLEMDQGGSAAVPLTLDGGYLPHDPVRYVNIFAQSKDDRDTHNGFFNPPVEFIASQGSEPVFAGLSYKHITATGWQIPEVSSLAGFEDTSVPPAAETLPLALRPQSDAPLYRHAETSEGIHEYRAYGINIFSRASDLGNTVQTDTTVFTKPNTLLAPHNVQVQLVQAEAPLILTSQSEQAALAAISTTDTTLVRITFDYTHLHDINYDYGTAVDIFFREDLPRSVVGSIDQIQNNPNAATVTLSTADYINHSVAHNDRPNIANALRGNFIGGILVLGATRYVIEDVVQTTPSGDFPSFVIRKKIDRNTLNPGSNQMVTAQSYLPLDANTGDRFSVIENMAKADHWHSSGALTPAITLGAPDWTPQPDSYINPEGTPITHQLGGLWGTATVLELEDDLSPANIIPAHYVIDFDSAVLDHHPQFSADISMSGGLSVEWYQGIIRLPVANDPNGTKPKKILKILRIENVGTGQPVRLIGVDDAPTAGDAVRLGSANLSNFYPGYRVYLRDQAASGFDAATILPALGDGSKKTLLGLRTRDTNTQDGAGNDYTSDVGIPQILFAQKIIDPVAPQRPTGPLYATPPNVFGKSTYSFETEFRAETFAAVYYRADTRAILRALYAPETVADLFATLPPLTLDAFYTDRIQHLLGFDYPDDTFSSFPLDTGAFAFPNPDNTDFGFSATGDQPSDVVALIKLAVASVFLPLTEQPLIYSKIRSGDYTPKSGKQVVRDKNGDILEQSDPRFEIAPMAVRRDGTHKVRFTDFTLDGEMSAETSYCYAVREMGNRMALSEPSEILGPIQLINKRPPQAPVIRSIVSRLSNPNTGDPAAVVFEVNTYSASEDIRFIELYRATDPTDALSPRTMQKARTIDIDLIETVGGVLKFVDDFDDLDVPPFGDPIFYKVVALRGINYVDHSGATVTQMVPSKPSKTLMSNIVDTTNPEPPGLSWTGTSQMSAQAPQLVEAITGFQLSWEKTTHNGTYLLHQMTASGRWATIHEVASNDPSDLSYTSTDPLRKYDSTREQELYHRFKVTVRNASGLENVSERILTV